MAKMALRSELQVSRQDAQYEAADKRLQQDRC